MLRFIKTGIFWGGIVSSNMCFCQENTPLGALPMQFNSSFAGEAESPRFCSNIAFNKLLDDSYFFQNNIGFHNSYDQFIPSIRSGVGINAGQSQSWSNAKNSLTTLGIVIAPKFSIKGKITISPSLYFQYNALNGTNFFSMDFSEKLYSTRANILINSSRFYIGYSASLINNYYNLNEWSEMAIWSNFHSTGVPGPFALKGFQSNLQIGYTFQRSTESNFSFTPQFLISINNFPELYSNNFRFTKIMLNFRNKNLLWGLSDSGLHVGWQTSKMRIVAFNDFYGLLFNKDLLYNNSNLSFKYIFK